MTRTIKISKGNQYDRNGYHLGVVGTGIYAFGKLGRRMDGAEGITFDGTYVPRDSERAAVEEAIRSVIETGEPQTLVFGQPEVAAEPVAEWTSPRGLTLTEEMDREDTIY